MRSRNKKFLLFSVITLACVLISPTTSWAGNKKRGRKKNLKPITHPVILWSRTLSETQDPEQRKIAAYKLSQYSQPIYQDSVISVLISCLKDSDVHIRVLCAKAMGRAGNQSKKSSLRTSLIAAFKEDPSLRETLTRTFIRRGDNSKEVTDLLLDTLSKSTDTHETLTILSYFYELGESVEPETFIRVFNKSENDKVKRWAIKVLAEHGNGEPTVIDALATCAESKDTPLALTCLSGLQSQSRKDSARTWSALEKTIESSDPDMLIATLDVLNVLPERINSPMAKRLIEIISEADEGELIDKAVLGLGVCGDQSLAVVETLQRLLTDKASQESTRIHAALVLGKQASLQPESSQEALKTCFKNSPTQSLRTACQLGSQELAQRSKDISRYPAASPTKSKPKS